MVLNNIIPQFCQLEISQPLLSNNSSSCTSPLWEIQFWEAGKYGLQSPRNTYDNIIPPLPIWDLSTSPQNKSSKCQHHKSKRQFCPKKCSKIPNNFGSGCYGFVVPRLFSGTNLFQYHQNVTLWCSRYSLQRNMPKNFNHKIITAYMWTSSMTHSATERGVRFSCSFLYGGWFPRTVTRKWQIN